MACRTCLKIRRGAVSAANAAKAKARQIKRKVQKPRAIV